MIFLHTPVLHCPLWSNIVSHLFDHFITDFNLINPVWGRLIVVFACLSTHYWFPVARFDTNFCPTQISNFLTTIFPALATKWSYLECKKPWVTLNKVPQPGRWSENTNKPWITCPFLPVIKDTYNRTYSLIAANFTLIFLCKFWTFYLSNTDELKFLYIKKKEEQPHLEAYSHC